jgi:NAD(P)-dependent dehydrogenase (short-subunit alcohol dehydrogenase family)
MDIAGRNVIVTGGASGIGRALCQELRRRGARGIVVADIDEAGASAVADEVGGLPCACDVSSEDEVKRLVDLAERESGPISLYVSNAGVAAFDKRLGDATSASNDAWRRSWEINVMAHVYAARAIAPLMENRGGGGFLITVSAAGLLSQIGGAAYATTKHAAIGFAESLAIAHRDAGLRVFALCPQGVDTPMLRALPEGPQSRDGVLTAGEVAKWAVDGVEADTFLILPHPQVADYMRRKSADYERWLAGMAKLQRASLASRRS